MAYEKLVKEILKDVGGKENINGLTHCITRLRFNLKDEEKANTWSCDRSSKWGTVPSCYW